MRLEHEEHLVDAPQVAILEALDAVLDRAVALVVVQHPEIAESDGFVGLPPNVWVADLLAIAMRDLQRLILRYREAAIDDARHRMSRLGREPITQPAPDDHDF
jgi:hypothetical protein